jgi:hypothetical protein
MFHLLFISLSVVLAAFSAAWAMGQYRIAHESIYAVTTAGAVATAAGLMWYGTAFQRKTRNL